VIRHVGPTRVTVELNSCVDALEIRVTDEGRRVAAADAPAGSPLPDRQPGSKAVGTSGKPGRGIVGMRERCQLLGGELDAKPTSSGGFEVTARLPLVPIGSG
jgi:signal transduction histidine kinase